MPVIRAENAPEVSERELDDATYAMFKVAIPQIIDLLDIALEARGELVFMVVDATMVDLSEGTDPEIIAEVQALAPGVPYATLQETDDAVAYMLEVSKESPDIARALEARVRMPVPPLHVRFVFMHRQGGMVCTIELGKLRAPAATLPN